jgi:hypothetical protein
MHQLRLRFFLIAISFAWRLAAQAPAQSAQPAPAAQEKRLFGIIPNYKTASASEPFKPISARKKLKLATQDAFDRGTFLLSGASAGLGQLRNENPSFGQGMEGYARYYGTSFADWAGGDYMTGAVFPILLHQDPRYFRKGVGSGFSRLKYAVSRIFWTRTDSGGSMFNFSEIGGNATMVAISRSYYADKRDASNAAEDFGIQVGVDMASNIVKEFYPDVKRMLHPKRGPSSTQTQH